MTRTSRLVSVAAKGDGAVITYRHNGYQRTVRLLRDDVAGQSDASIKAVVLGDLVYEGVESDPFSADEWASVCRQAKEMVK